MRVEIRVKGHLLLHWEDWLEGFAVVNEESGEAVITGQLPDQAALLGLFNRLHALNLPVLAYQQLSIVENER